MKIDQLLDKVEDMSPRRCDPRGVWTFIESVDNNVG
jgi:hypothetical protein